MHVAFFQYKHHVTKQIERLAAYQNILLGARASSRLHPLTPPECTMGLVDATGP
jgi:hypothetical protein